MTEFLNLNDIEIFDSFIILLKKLRVKKWIIQWNKKYILKIKLIKSFVDKSLHSFNSTAVEDTLYWTSYVFGNI